MTADVTKRTLFGFSALLFLFLFCSLPASANATYVYTGTPFTIFNNGASCVGSCNLSISFTFATPLGDNGVFNENNNPLLSFSITDGALGPIAENLNLNNSSNFSFQLFTDGSGNIVEWSIGVSTSNGDVFLGTVNESSATDEVISLPIGVGPNALNQTVPGTWTLESSTAPTPEPSSLLLLGTGLLGLGPLLRRRLAKP